MLTKCSLGFATTALALGAAGLAQGAGIEQVVPSTTRVLFEEGSYAEVAVSYTDPYQRGENAAIPGPFGPVPATGRTGDVFDPFWNYSGAWKTDLAGKFSLAVLIDQPYGADTTYGADDFAPPVFSYEGTSADVDTVQFAGLIAFDLRKDIKLYGGIRALRSKARASVPFISPPGAPSYSVVSDPEWGYGYTLGAAYDRPEVGLRVSLTYASEVETDYGVEEFGSVQGHTNVTYPQSVALDFQTGITPKTLLFGSARWVDWSEFAISPPQYVALIGQPLVAYDGDWTTYTLGIGRQFTDRLAGALSLSYEPDVGGDLMTLGPYDGRTLGTASLNYDFDRISVTGGLTYGRLGDTNNPLRTRYNDGSVWGAGLRIGYSF
jgi:long-chain fatty acid transport protein